MIITSKVDTIYIFPQLSRDSRQFNTTVNLQSISNLTEEAFNDFNRLGRFLDFSNEYEKLLAIFLGNFISSGSSSSFSSLILTSFLRRLKNFPTLLSSFFFFFNSLHVWLLMESSGTFPLKILLTPISGSSPLDNMYE